MVWWETAARTDRPMAASPPIATGIGASSRTAALCHADAWQGTLQHLDTGRFRPSQLIIDIPRSDFTLTSINHARGGRKGMRLTCTLGTVGVNGPPAERAFQSHEVIR